MKQLKNILSITLISSFIFFIYSSSGGQSTAEVNKEINDDITEKYGCGSIDECITQYKFDGARAFAGSYTGYSSTEENGAWQKILTSEANYWINNADFERALNVITEGKDFYKDIIDRPAPEKYNLARYNVLSTIIDKLLDQEKFKEAKRYAIKSCDCNMNGRTKADQKDYDGGDEKWDDSASMKNTLLKRINETEELLK
jgi:hypothetical protein